MDSSVFISVPTESEESQNGAIVGGIFAVIVVILIAVAVVILYKRYTKEKITKQKVTLIKTYHIFSMPYIYYYIYYYYVFRLKPRISRQHTARNIRTDSSNSKQIFYSQ